MPIIVTQRVNPSLYINSTVVSATAKAQTKAANVLVGGSAHWATSVVTGLIVTHHPHSTMLPVGESGIVILITQCRALV